MSQTYNITGSGSFLSNLARGLFVAAATIGGLFLFAASAAFAFFVVAGLVVLGLVVFAFFWTRAKIFGRPFGPKAHFEAARKEMEAQMKASGTTFRSGSLDDEGPVIDAHRTPDGWTVDD
jgi:hypothetical protein